MENRYFCKISYISFIWIWEKTYVLENTRNISFETEFIIFVKLSFLPVANAQVNRSLAWLICKGKRLFQKALTEKCAPNFMSWNLLSSRPPKRKRINLHQLYLHELNFMCWISYAEFHELKIAECTAVKVKIGTTYINSICMSWISWAEFHEHTAAKGKEDQPLSNLFAWAW